MVATRVASIAASLLLVFSAAPAVAQTSQGTSLSLSPHAVTPRSYTVDVESRYSTVGAAIIDVGPNDFKIPEGIRATASGPTFFDRVPGKPDKPIIVAVASDGGDVCFTKDVRARVDTYEVQRWISDTIRQKLGVDASLEGGDR